ncbi:MAG: NUDIX domain-containing protein [Balneolaceae bacterium]|nr:NUDIX domain-containing protein [Balneolaceae bacterium]
MTENSSEETVVIEAAGGVVHRTGSEGHTEVLLIYRNDVWDLPKGKLEEGETIDSCAVREVSEEVGSSLPSIISKTGTTYHEYKEKGKLLGKTTHWYSMVFSKQEEDLRPEQEEGITDVCWIRLAEAIEKVGYDNLKEILLAFQQQKKA